MAKPIGPDFLLFRYLILISSMKLSCCDSSAPLSTKDFYKQIYSDVCPSGEPSCLREVMTGSLQLSLPRNNSDKVGAEKKIQLFQEKEHTVKTLSRNPPIFEIEDFFTPEECEFVIDLAKAKGLRRNPTSINAKTMFKDDIEETFKMWNLNGDEFIDANEVAYVYGKAGVFSTEQHVLDMFESTEVDTDGNGKLDEREFKNINQQKFEEYVNNNIVNEQNSESNKAFTQQTWLWHDEDELLGYEDVFENYHERVAQSIGLPKKIVEHSEPIQVVKFERDAHYECHHDTQSFSNDVPCCQYGSANCRLCRYLTITVYLTDDYEGGEKCFPFADNETFSQKHKFADENVTVVKGHIRGNISIDLRNETQELPREYLKKCNLAKSCDACNVMVKPKIGKAVMWYNHLLNRHGWMGALDALSGHGDCKSRNGEKWIANIWIDIIGDGKHELRSWKSGTNWIKPGNKDIEIYSVLGNPDLKPKSYYTQFKERYSGNKNKMFDPNIKIGDTKIYFNENEEVKRSNLYHDGPEQDSKVQTSRIVQSIILLLDELSQNELDYVADVLRSKMKPETST